MKRWGWKREGEERKDGTDAYGGGGVKLLLCCAGIELSLHLRQAQMHAFRYHIESPTGFMNVEDSCMVLVMHKAHIAVHPFKSIQHDASMTCMYLPSPTPVMPRTLSIVIQEEGEAR